MGDFLKFFGSMFGKRPKEVFVESAPREGKSLKQPEREGELYQPGDILHGGSETYEIVRKVGEGGFGVVFHARLPGWQGDLALKTFRDEFLVDATTREAFKKEALLWAGLEDHPFILAARLVDEVYGRLFVAMDYVSPDKEGRVSLEDYLKGSRGAFPLEQTLRLGVQFCLGMEHAVAHGIRCHRDIKPSNVLIMGDGTPKISDFGLAGAVEGAWGGGRSVVSGGGGSPPGCSLLVSAGRRVCGTPGYIAPEVYEGKGADIRSDIYSFGIVLWQMAKGSVVSAFNAPEVKYRGDREKWLQEYQEGVYGRQRMGRWEGVGSPLEGVIEGCLAYDRGKRFRDFGELRKELERMYKRERGGPVPVPALPEKTVFFWNNKGISLQNLGRNEEAIRCFDEALKLDPRDAAAWNNKGNILDDLGRNEEAIRCYDEALRIDPRFALAWYNKSLSEKKLSRTREEARSLRRFIELAPPQYSQQVAFARQRLNELERNQ